MSLRPAVPALRPRPQAPLLPKVRGQFAEFPHPECPRHALGFSPRGTCVGSRYGRGGSFPKRFSLAPGIGRTALYGRLFPLSPGSRHYGTPQAYTVKRGGGPARPTPRRHASGLRRRESVPPRYRNINLFPFRPGRLALALGPTNSQLTTHCWETLAPSAVGILTRLCCYYRRDLQSGPVHRTSRPGFCPTPTPPYRIEPLRLNPAVSAAGLAPSIFGAPSLGG